MPTPFGAGRAALSFVFLLAAQFWAGVVVIFAAVPVAMLRGGDLDDPRFLPQLLRDVTPPLLVAGGLLSIALLAAIARLWAWDLTRDLIRRVPRPPAILAWALVGAALAGLYIFVVHRVVPPDPSTPLGPLAKAASQSGASRVAWALLAFFFAPPFEELLFRGLLFEGFAKSWGVRAGAAVTTVLFVVLHLFETWNYWPATAGILTMAIATMTARLHTRSIVAPVAAHAAYNGVLVAVVFSS